MDRKTYTKHELATVLAEHQKWLTTRWNEAAEGSRAVLRDADLTRAVLTGADLRGADLGDGIRWEQYKTEVVPALCVAGGKTLDETANPETWGCHSWKSDRLRCPMAVAFDADRIADVPPLYRALANDFIQYFDTGIIPLGEVNPKYAQMAEHRIHADAPLFADVSTSEGRSAQPHD